MSATILESPPSARHAGTRRDPALIAGGAFSLVFALFQASAVFWPTRWIAALGGPVELSRTKPVLYAALCLVIALVVAACGVYALSGAGVLRRLSGVRTVVTATTAVYLVRGLLLVPQLPVLARHPEAWRFGAFSVIALAVGVVHLVGTIRLYREGRTAPGATGGR